MLGRGQRRRGQEIGEARAPRTAGEWTFWRAKWVWCEMLQKVDGILVNLMVRKPLATWARTSSVETETQARGCLGFLLFVSLTPCDGPTRQAFLLLWVLKEIGKLSPRKVPWGTHCQAVSDGAGVQTSVHPDFKFCIFLVGPQQFVYFCNIG